MHRNTKGESPCVANVKTLCQKVFRMYVVHNCGDRWRHPSSCSGGVQ